jgi:hypothetical protein
MNALLRITGIGRLVSFYRYIYLNLPQLTRLAGLALILTVGAIHLIEAPAHFKAAVYLGVLFAMNFAGTLVAAIGIFRGAKGWGWTLGALIFESLFLAGWLSVITGLAVVAPDKRNWHD